MKILANLKLFVVEGNEHMYNAQRPTHLLIYFVQYPRATKGKPLGLFTASGDPPKPVKVTYSTTKLHLTLNPKPLKPELHLTERCRSRSSSKRALRPSEWAAVGFRVLGV